MDILSSLVALVMGIVALAHFYWAFGGDYGLSSAGPKLKGSEVFKPGRLLTFIVACILMGLAILALQLRAPWQPLESFISYIGFFVSVVLILRAIGDFNYVGFFKKTYNSDFARVDTKYFSPGILLLGIAYAILST